MGRRQLVEETASRRQASERESDPPSSAWWRSTSPADEDDGPSAADADLDDWVFQLGDGEDWPPQWGAARLGIP